MKNDNTTYNVREIITSGNIDKRKMKITLKNSINDIYSPYKILGVILGEILLILLACIFIALDYLVFYIIKKYSQIKILPYLTIIIMVLFQFTDKSVHESFKQLIYLVKPIMLKGAKIKDNPSGFIKNYLRENKEKYYSKQEVLLDYNIIKKAKTKSDNKFKIISKSLIQFTSLYSTFTLRDVYASVFELKSSNNSFYIVLFIIYVLFNVIVNRMAEVTFEGLIRSTKYSFDRVVMYYETYINLGYDIDLFREYFKNNSIYYIE